eukprot:964153-Ditylum_brightwellii.AAC.1
MKEDERRNKHGAAKRDRFDVQSKSELIQEVDDNIESSESNNATEYFRDVKKMDEHNAIKWAQRYITWSKEDHHRRLLKEVNRMNKKSKGKKGNTLNMKSPYHDIETEMYELFKKEIIKCHKVSATILQVNALKILNKEGRTSK